MSEEDVKIGLIYHIEDGQMTKAPTATTLKILIGSRKARIWSSFKSTSSTWILADPSSAVSVKIVEIEYLGSSNPEDESILSLKE